jgi:DNA polymerase III sliding clamp (beta) subunit (PCNA family)
MSQRLFAKIHARDIAKVAPFRAEQDVRYYLHGVHVEPVSGGVVVCATNGHMLAATFSEGSHVDEACILDMPSSCANAITRAARNQGSYLSLEDKNSRLEVVTKRDSMRAGVMVETSYVKPGRPLIDARFPEWRKVIPKNEDIVEGISATYNPDYLRAAINAVYADESEYRSGAAGLRFFHRRDMPNESALLIRSGPTFFVVIMPMRAPDMTPIPDWVTARVSGIESSAAA